MMTITYHEMYAHCSLHNTVQLLLCTWLNVTHSQNAHLPAVHMHNGMKDGINFYESWIQMSKKKKNTKTIKHILDSRWTRILGRCEHNWTLHIHMDSEGENWCQKMMKKVRWAKRRVEYWLRYVKFMKFQNVL